MTEKPDYSRSLRFSLFDGLFTSVAMGLTMNFVTPLALALKATNFQIGLLSSLAQVFSSLSQFKSADFLDRIKSRARTTGFFVAVQATMFIVIAAVPFLFRGPSAVPWLIVIYALAISSNAFVFPIWASLMSDTVDKEQYGRFFGWRNRLFGFVGMGASFSAGLILDRFHSHIFAGFALLFGAAAIIRYFAGYFISRMDEIPITITQSDRFSYLDFIRRLPESNFAKFSLSYALYNFVLAIAAPFFAVYMLKEIGMSYSSYTTINIAAAVAGTLSLTFWGRYADKLGNARIIKTAVLLSAFLPLLWMVSKNTFWLVAINAVGGYIWAGINLSIPNFIFDAATPGKRPRVIAYHTITNALSSSAGMLLGGFLLPRMPRLIMGSQFLTLFAVVCVLRISAALVMLRSFREVRKTEELDDAQFALAILQIRPITEFVNETLLFWRKK